MLIQRSRRLLRGLARKLTFLADVAHHAELVLDPSIDAVAIDVVHWRIALNPTWCTNLDDDDLEFVLAHELFHVFLRTGPRGEGTDGIYWNFAHDLVINQRVAELLERPVPARGVTLAPDERISAESAYLRARRDRDLDRLQTWLRSSWKVDAHPDASTVLANARAGHRGASIAAHGDIVTYVAVDHEAGRPGDEHAAIIETTRVQRPWPVAWLAALRGSGYHRARSWLRPSRRSAAGALAPGRHRVAADEVTVLFDVTPAMLAHAEKYLAWLRAFAIDNGIERLRLVSVDEIGVVADEIVEVATWKGVRLPRALVIQRSDESIRLNGMWVCKHCKRPHAAKRPNDEPPALRSVDRLLRTSAIAVVAPGVRG